MMIFPIIMIFLFASMISIIKKIKITESLPIASLMLILVMYIVSLLNLLQFSLVILLAIFSITAVYIFTYEKDSLKLVWKDLITPGGIAIIFLIFALYFLSIDVLCFQGDEYSHWATTVKDMFYSNRLSIYNSSVTTYKTYQPGLALWQYFFLQSSAEYSDGIIIFAYNVYLLMLMAPIFSRITWKNSWVIPILILIVYMVPYWYYTPWQGVAWRCIYCERAISFTFAYIMYVYFVRDKEDNAYILPFTLGACVLPLFKSIGSAFSCFAIIAVIVDILCQKRKRMWWENIKNILISFFFMLATVVSWTLKLRVSKTPNVWDASRLTVKRLFMFLTGHEEQWIYDLTRDFVSATCQRNMQSLPGIIEVNIIAIPIVWIVVLFLKNIIISKEGDKRNSILACVMVIEAFLFQVSILLSYFYVFPKDAAISLAAFERYSAMYMLGGSWFLFMYLLDGVLKIESKKVKVGMVLSMFVFVLSTVPLEQVSLDILNHKDAVKKDYDNNLFSQYDGMEKKISKFIDETDKVYILSYQDLNTSYLMRKFFIPAKTDLYMQGVTEDDGLKTWEDIIISEGYTYVYVNKTNEEFEQLHRDFFPDKMIEENTLYKIDESGKGLVKIDIFE